MQLQECNRLARPTGRTLRLPWVVRALGLPPETRVLRTDRGAVFDAPGRLLVMQRAAA